MISVRKNQLICSLHPEHRQTPGCESCRIITLAYVEGLQFGAQEDPVEEVIKANTIHFS
jgi:hypothetical protein